MSSDPHFEFKAPARFDVQRRLGAGGFGVVYEAYDFERQTQVALKTLARNDPAALYRFKQEFRTLADLAHPNLVRLHELLADGDRWLLAMELVHGVNFLHYVRGEPRASMPPELVSTPSVSESAPTIATAPGADEGVTVDRRWRPVRFQPERLRAGLGQLVDGVRHLHQHGILHRDIKPSNVLVTREGRVVLLDFGLATEFTNEGPGDTLRIAGTPEYMSPEQAASGTLTEASDWYSVGVVLYVALTGRPPFHGPFLSLAMEKQQRDAVPPHTLVRDLPGDLDALCCDLLRRDPASRPSGAEIADRLSGHAVVRATAAPAPSRARASHPFVGRDRELALLQDALRTARSGRVATAYIRGNSGMGKSALVRHFLRAVHEQDPDTVVLAGRCYEQEAVPYKALDSVVDALAEYLRGLPRAQAESLLPRGVWALARVFPVLQRVSAVSSMRGPAAEIQDSHELRRRASAALREMLGRIAERHPLIVFIDDLQWGDVDSASLLTDLLRPPDPPALLLLACYRRDEAETSAVLRTLLAMRRDREAEDVVTVDVDELSPAEADALARALVGGDGHAQARAGVIARESGGHPFFIDQLARYGDAGADASLDSVLLARAARLPASARALLEVAAVAGRPLDVAIANQAADLETGDYDAVSELRAGRFIRTRVAGAREIEPYHDRVRETIVGSLAPDALRRHHQRLAVALEASGRADPEALAVHFRGAGDNDRAASYTVAAADQSAAALAFDRAARLYELALTLRAWDAGAHHRLLVKLGDALGNGGRVIEAARAYLAAAGGASGREQRELQRQAGEQFLMGGYLEDGLSLLRTVLKSAGVPLPSSARRALLWILLRRPYVLLRGTRFRMREEREIAAEDLWRVDLVNSVVRSLGFTETIYAIEFQMRHLLLALKLGEPYRVARAVGFEAIADARDRSSRARAERLHRQEVDLLRVLPPQHQPEIQAGVHVTAGMIAFLSGRWKAASQELLLAEQLFREQSAVPYKLVVVQTYTLSSLYHQGQLPEYFRRVPECLRESLDRGNAFAEANMRLQNAHLLCFAEDDPAAAFAELQEARRRWSPRGFLQVHAAEMFHRADFALYCGDVAGAWDGVTRGSRDLSRSMLLRLQTVRVMSRFVRARAALAMAATSSGARDARYLESAERDAGRLAGERIGWATPMADLVRACIAARRRDLRRAAALFTAAETGFHAADMTLHAAVARSARGAVVGGDEGRALVSGASDWMAAQGVKSPGRMHAMYAPGLET